MPLTKQDVDNISGSLLSRCAAGSSSLSSQKSVFGDLTGNNDTVDQSVGALSNIASQISPNWTSSGYQYADACAAGSEQQQIPGNAAGKTYADKINDWRDAGLAFNAAIDQIDHYGTDATLQSVLGQTAVATGQQVAKEARQAASVIASLIPWYVYAGALAAGGLVIFLMIKTSPKISVG